MTSLLFPTIPQPIKPSDRSLLKPIRTLKRESREERRGRRLSRCAATLRFSTHFSSAAEGREGRCGLKERRLGATKTKETRDGATAATAPPFFPPHSPFESADLAQKRPREISHSTKLDSGGSQQRQREGRGKRAVNMYPTEKKRIEQKQPWIGTTAWLFLTDSFLCTNLRKFCGSTIVLRFQTRDFQKPRRVSCTEVDPVRIGVLPCLVVRGRLEGRKSMHAGELMNPASASRAEQSARLSKRGVRASNEREGGRGGCRSE